MILSEAHLNLSLSSTGPEIVVRAVPKITNVAQNCMIELDAFRFTIMLHRARDCGLGSAKYSCHGAKPYH